MTVTETRSPLAVTTWVRRGLLALTAVGIAATAFELASERHWKEFEQLIPWFALAVLTAALVLACTASRPAHLVARVLAVLVMCASLYGVIDHAAANHNSGPLDQRYADSWDSMPVSQQWWYAVTKTVGPAPTLAPGTLAQTALLLILASALRAPRPEQPEPN